MKSNVFKIGLPLAVIAFGLASAAGTSSISGSSKLAGQDGYEHIDVSSACDNPIAFCNEENGENCTAPNGHQLYSQPSNCVTPLKRSKS